MDIVVLLKQVPATETIIEIAEDGRSVKTENVKWVVNPYDEIAVEEALRIREARGGTVTILSAGPDKATEAIRTALAMGADKGILISDPAVQGLDGLGIAKILAAALQAIPFDLVIAGQRAVDDDNYLVGMAVAEFAKIPCIPMVIREEIADRKIRCIRTVDGGTVAVEAALPVLFTTQRGLNDPRYTSLPGIMKAKKKPIETRSLSDIGLNADAIGKPGARTVAIRLPPERTGGKIIDGESATAKAAELVRLLHEEARVV